MESMHAMGEWGLGLVNTACRKAINIACYGEVEEGEGIPMDSYYQSGGLGMCYLCMLGLHALFRNFTSRIHMIFFCLLLKYALCVGSSIVLNLFNVC